MPPRSRSSRRETPSTSRSGSKRPHRPAKSSSASKRDGSRPTVASVVEASDQIGSPEEIAWAFRKLFESLAREQPLVVVDDIHWAEPTLLDLIEYRSEERRVGNECIER